MRKILHDNTSKKRAFKSKLKGVIMQGEYITKEAWAKMFCFLKTVKNIHIGTEASCKKFIEAIYWMTRSGAQWRMLPSEYGLWNSIFKRFNSWSKKGIWDELHSFCIQDPDMEYIMFDATIVRTHACAAGYGEQSDEGLGRSKGGFTTKIHTLVDALGNPLKFLVTPGQDSDISWAGKLVGAVRGTYAIGDRGYDSDEFRAELRNKHYIPVIPGRSNRIVKIEYDKHIYKERNVIEGFFSKLKYFRHVFSRFDKSARNYTSFLSFVGAILWLR